MSDSDVTVLPFYHVSFCYVYKVTRSTRYGIEVMISLSIVTLVLRLLVHDLTDAY